MSTDMMTLEGSKRALDATAVDELRSRMRGPVLPPATTGTTRPAASGTR